MTGKAFQDLLGPDNHCHGCGSHNPHGLRIKSYWEGVEAICRWRPQPHHCAGSEAVVNGGVIASLIDCHSVNLAMAAAYKDEGREVGSNPKIWYVTASLKIDYLKPTPIDQELVLRASITRSEGRKTWLRCSLHAAAALCADGEIMAVRIARS